MCVRTSLSSREISSAVFGALVNCCRVNHRSVRNSLLELFPEALPPPPVDEALGIEAREKTDCDVAAEPARDYRKDIHDRTTLWYCLVLSPVR